MLGEEMRAGVTASEDCECEEEAWRSIKKTY